MRRRRRSGPEFKSWPALRDEYDSYYEPIDRGIFESIGLEMQRRGFATIDDLSRVGFWKYGSWRHEKKLTSRTNRRLVAKLTKKAFGLGKSGSKQQVAILGWNEGKLKGVGVPMASALLAVHDPKNYAVIDRNAWYTYACLTRKKRLRKTSFSPDDYEEFVRFCRTARKGRPGWTTRDVEKVLFVWGVERY